MKLRKKEEERKRGSPEPTNFNLVNVYIWCSGAAHTIAFGTWVAAPVTCIDSELAVIVCNDPFPSGVAIPNVVRRNRPVLCYVKECVVKTRADSLSETDEEEEKCEVHNEISRRWSVRLV